MLYMFEGNIKYTLSRNMTVMIFISTKMTVSCQESLQLIERNFEVSEDFSSYYFEPFRNEVSAAKPKDHG